MQHEIIKQRIKSLLNQNQFDKSKLLQQLIMLYNEIEKDDFKVKQLEKKLNNLKNPSKNDLEPLSTTKYKLDVEPHHNNSFTLTPINESQKKLCYKEFTTYKCFKDAYKMGDHIFNSLCDMEFKVTNYYPS